MFDPDISNVAAPYPGGVPARPVPAAYLPERAALGPVLDRQLALCRRSGQSLAYLSISLDGLEALAAGADGSDKGGAAGDPAASLPRVLQVLWARLRGNLRSTDQLLRLGRDEFGALLIGARPGSVAPVRARLTRLLSQPCVLGTQTVAVSARIGTGLFPQSGQTSDELLRDARRNKANWL